ncbi:MAG: DUF2007 domain-containing protein [Hellea sp.]|jgi:predicted transcriptional regulator
MTPILKTVNMATLNYAQAILKEADIPFFTMDENVSIIEGSIGIIPRRLMVLDDDFEDAVDVFKLAGLSNEIHQP